ncbi:hypothetical protein BGZ67_007915 [Mortierella alpina]|nr:hypothetical protein BGZ67_007915 [Mortierella alpina]
MPLARFKRKSPPQEQSSTMAPITPHALHIPEILELILSFLSEHTLRHVTALVSTDWLCLSRRLWLRDSVSLWASNAPPEKRSQAMDGFSTSQILTLAPDAREQQRRSLYPWPFASHAQRQIAWREVLSRLQTLAISKALDRIRMLELRGHLDVRVFTRVVEQCCLGPQLVVLRLESFDKGDYYFIERALKGCPKLQELTVLPRAEGVDRQAVPGESPEDPGSGSEAVKEASDMLVERRLVEPLDWNLTLKLKTLVLFKPMLSQRVLEAILRCCPEMTVLKLISVIERASFQDAAAILPADATATTATTVAGATGGATSPISPSNADGNSENNSNSNVIINPAPTAQERLSATAPYDISTFLVRIARSCPKLHTFHLSLQTRRLTKGHLKTMLTEFTRLQHWSFVTRDVASPPILPLLHDRTLSSSSLTVNALLSNRMTTLEIRNAGLTDGFQMTAGPDGWSTSTLSRALHDFLCTTPTLRHLIAPTVTYYTEYMDLNRVLVGSRDSHPDTPRSDGRFWACRALETLHLEIRARYEADTLHHSRVIFGYLSKCCPQLVDLQIRRPYLSFWLVSGMCLLSRLHRLERLRLCCRSYTRFDAEVLEWIRREGHPWGKVSPRGVASSSSFVEATKLAWRMMMIRANVGRSRSALSSLSAAAAAATANGISPHSFAATAASSASSATGFPALSPKVSALLTNSLAASDTMRELSLKDFATLGDMKDIEDLQIERLLQYRLGLPCWPRLESWTIEHDGWFDDGTKIGIERLRPDVEFRFSTRSFHGSEYP